MTRKQSFLGDERAIEGLPIRLVIALVVGVASLAIMMQLLGGIGSVGQTEVDAQFGSNGGTVSTSGSSNTVQITVVTSEGKTVSEKSRVVLTGGSLELTWGSSDKKAVTKTTSSGKVSFTISSDDVDFQAGQNKGTLKVDIKPPSDSNYKDDEGNREVLVTK